MTKSTKNNILTVLVGALLGALFTGIGWAVVVGHNVVDRDELQNYVHEESGIVGDIGENRGRIERLELLVEDVRAGMTEHLKLLLRIEGKIDKED